MITDWKKFEDVNKRLEHRITITKSGYIGLPTKFYEDHEIAKYKYVILFFSASENAIGIKFLKDKDVTEKAAIKIHHNKEGKGGWIVARNFFRINNIDYKTYSSRYEWNTENPENIGAIYVLRLRSKNAAPSIG